MRDMAPSSTLPSTTDKSSIVSRDSYGNITVATITGSLTGQADTALIANNAVKLATARTINGVSFDGTANITIEDSTKLSTNGGSLTGKLTLPSSINARASLNIATGVEPDSANKITGDVWLTTSGLFYHNAGQTERVAVTVSPTFLGIPRAPGFDGFPSQIITLTHLSDAVSTLNSSIATKAALSSPTFTGTPSAPTAATGTNSTQIATTAFIKAAVDAKATEITSAYQAYTTSAVSAYGSTVDTLLAAKASLASPQLTGIPLAPTASVGTNSTQIATTAFTTSAVTGLQNTLTAAIAALQDAVNSTRPVPVGAVFYMAGGVVPYGYLEANGQAISRSTYASLWQYLGSPNTGDGSTTFNLPDLRGEFVRGWDHGRGIDTNREIRSVQYSQNLEHNHAIPGDDQLTFADGYGGWTASSRGTFPYDARSSYGGGGTIWNTTTEGGSESRPRNVALMPIIKW
jgi:hypothetical protein